MKYFYFVILSFITLLFISCSEVKPSQKNRVKFQKSAIILLSMYDNPKYKNNCRVYINYKDSNTTLIPNSESEFEVQEGQTNIQIVKNRETASINLETQKGKIYKLRIIKDERGHIELLQVSNNSNE